MSDFFGEMNLPGGTDRPCIRCLLSDLPEGAALARSLRELIEMIPAGDRADRETVQKRLDACRECGFLNRGTCGLCGCYVEHRAEKRGACCPDTPPRW